jgi:hypothetical protein
MGGSKRWALNQFTRRLVNIDAAEYGKKPLTESIYSCWGRYHNMFLFFNAFDNVFIYTGCVCNKSWMRHDFISAHRIKIYQMSKTCWIKIP